MQALGHQILVLSKFYMAFLNVIGVMKLWIMHTGKAAITLDIIDLHVWHRSNRTLKKANISYKH